MYRLIYVSAATVLFSRDDLLTLLRTSHTNNARIGITGMLLYRDGDFMQLLEGEEKGVRALYDRIEEDPRHTGTLVMLEERSAERLFNDWSMGFRDLDDPAVQATPGFTAFLNTPLRDQRFSEQPGEALTLLMMFKPAL